MFFVIVAAALYGKSTALLALWGVHNNRMNRIVSLLGHSGLCAAFDEERRTQ